MEENYRKSCGKGVPIGDEWSFRDSGWESDKNSDLKWAGVIAFSGVMRLGPEDGLGVELCVFRVRLDGAECCNREVELIKK